MAKPDLGAKRQCLNCGTKFFDFSKDPILCPKCGTVFQAAPLTRAPVRSANKVEEDDAEVEAGPEVVSLEDAAVEEDKGASVDEDIEVDDDTAADDTFLEEEETDPDDVADLIDSDIEDDEEG